MGWSDKAVSPAIWTPQAADAGGMSLDTGLVLSDGKVGAPALATYRFFRLITSASQATDIAIKQIEIHDLAGRFTPLDMTSNSGGGFALTRSSIYSAFEPWLAFDNSTSTYWNSGSGASQWVKIECPTAKAPNKYKIIGYPNNSPTSWVLEASSTGEFSGEQVALHTVSSFDWAGNYEREWII